MKYMRLWIGLMCWYGLGM